MHQDRLHELDKLHIEAVQARHTLELAQANLMRLRKMRDDAQIEVDKFIDIVTHCEAMVKQRTEAVHDYLHASIDHEVEMLDAKAFGEEKI